jgi:hypothetical protein
LRKTLRKQAGFEGRKLWKLRLLRLTQFYVQRILEILINDSSPTKPPHNQNCWSGMGLVSFVTLPNTTNMTTGACQLSQKTSRFDR